MDRNGVDLLKLVGPPGFEPGTSCTPSKRASQAAPRPERLSVPHPFPAAAEVSRSWYAQQLKKSRKTERGRRALCAIRRDSTQCKMNFHAAAL